MRTIFHFFRNMIIALFIFALGAGFYLGHEMTENLLNAPWDEILGIVNHRGMTPAMREVEAWSGGKTVSVISADGTELKGTWMPDPGAGRPTVILLHGLYQNRSMCLPYTRMYRNLGYNMILIDQRGHGESGGGRTTWGLRETEDISAWVKWARKNTPSGEIGLHGVSLGAAMSLLYSGTEEGRNLSFVISDSSYGNLEQLAEEKLFVWLGDERALWGLRAIYPFFQADLLFRYHKTTRDMDPLNAVTHSTVPTLFLHGTADTLVPYERAEELYEASSSPSKKLYLFENVSHAAEWGASPSVYSKVVGDFLGEIQL